MHTVVIEIDKLKELLKSSYSAGWSGSIELKDGVVDNLVNEYLNTQIAKPVTKTDESLFSFTTQDPSYFRTTLPPATNTANLLQIRNSSNTLNYRFNGTSWDQLRPVGTSFNA